MQSKLQVLGIIAGAAMSLLAVPANADSFSVFVGYADNLRPSGFFPTPWIGASNVVSQSSASQTFDSGAIQIANNGATAITITNFQVTFPNNPGFTASEPSQWATSLTVNPGQTAIYTQTTSYNFDTSDFGVFGGYPNSTLLYPNNYGGNGNTSGIGGCSSSAALIAAAGDTTLCASAIPVVSFDENGTPVSFSDTGHILDTGGYDFINLSSDGNESINWNLIGAEASRGGTVPEPTSVLLLATVVMLCGFSVRRAVARRTF